MAESAEYPQQPRNTIRRYRDRGAYDFATVHSILSEAPVLHISFLPSDLSEDVFPTTLPMIGAVASFSNPSADPGSDVHDIYVHGHSASRLMKLPNTSPNAMPEGVPVCVCATIVDGIILALTPFSHSCNYRSAVVHGYASVVTDDAEKSFALQRITDGLVPQRWDNTRVPPSKAEFLSTSILKITVETASAKIHVGGPNDDRKDLKNDEVTGRVWAGVMPIHQYIGEPIPGDNNKVDKLPDYLAKWREQSNQAGEKYAHDVALIKKKK